MLQENGGLIKEDSMAHKKMCKEPCNFVYGSPTVQCYRCIDRVSLLTKKQMEEKTRREIEECWAVLRETI